jgi:hypothetical protein
MTNVVGLVREYQFILLPIALGLLLPTLMMPWIIINFQGITGLTPLDLMFGSYEHGSTVSDNKGLPSSSREHNELIFLDLVSPYNIFGIYALWILTYLASMITMILCIVLKKWRSRFAIIAGILAVVASLTWFYTIEALKINFVQQASVTGGLIGEEFRGSERILVDEIVRMGFGPYLALIAGATGIIPYFTKRYVIKRDNSRHVQEKGQPT